MGWAVLAGLMVSVAAATPPTAISVQSGNALTLPAQRHVVRVSLDGGSVYVAAVQQGGRQGRRLGMYRSTNGGSSWHYEGAIEEGSNYNRADMLVVGDDVALVYSIETPDSQGIPGSTQHDVYFQWWRYSESRDRFVPDRPVRVFDSTSSRTAYYRAELARDSKGRLWVQAFRRESSGSNTLDIAVSTDRGNTFRDMPSLASGISARGGGRLIATGGKLLMLWGSHGTSDAARYRIRDDDDSLSSWSSTRTAFSEGIYHGAALSAVEDGKGGAHIVYKDKAERLRYRHFDGKQFGASLTVLEDGDWASQPALTRVGSTLLIFYNRPYSGGRGYDLMVRKLSSGHLGSSVKLGSVSGFGGYPSSVEVLPGGVRVPCLFGLEPSSGDNRVSVLSTSSPSSKSVTEDDARAEASLYREDDDAEERRSLAVEGMDGPSMMDPPAASGTAGASPLALTGTTGAEGAAGCGGNVALAVGVSLVALGMRRRGARMPGGFISMTR